MWIQETWNVFKKRWTETNFVIKSNDKLEIIIHNTTHTLEETINMLHDALIMGGPHGAGLVNMFLADKKTALFELHPEFYGSSEYVLDCFSNLASQLDISYTQICGETGSGFSGTVKYKKSQIMAGMFSLKTQIDNKLK